MRRYQLIELHEQSWYPESWREIFQITLGRAGSLLQPMNNLTDRLRSLLERFQPGAVLDLCSGSGEISARFWDKVTSELGIARRPRLLLSDLYPNTSSYAALKQEYKDLVDYMPEPVNALNPPDIAVNGWMMVEGLHHFSPDEIRKILYAATERVDGFFAFELTQRKWRNIAFSLLVTPLPTVILTAFMIRPLRLRNVLWGLVLPVIPLTMVFDGVVSHLRSYSKDELDEIIESIEPTSFEWETGTVGMSNVPGLEQTYAFGWRRKANRDVPSSGSPRRPL